MESFPHLPVLLHEVCDAFAPLSLHAFIDGTLGAGGHAASLLQLHPEISAFLGIDQDSTALDIARKRLEPWKKVTRFAHGNFVDMTAIAASFGLTKVDGILMDIGVSSMQLGNPERGFSFMHDGPLDMRMDQLQPLTAAEIVNSWPEQELGRIFREYGEERHWRIAARTIVRARLKAPIQTTRELVELLRPVLQGRHQAINPATRVFQALRICVNEELVVLERQIPQAIDLLNPGGRLAIIAFHSLEDRIVKNAFRFAASDKVNTSGIGGLFLEKEPTVKLITNRPWEASEEEIAANPRCRSAKLRVVEKIALSCERGLI